jgi:hypothetical protein
LVDVLRRLGRWEEAIAAGDDALRRLHDSKWRPLIEFGVELAKAHDRDAHTVDEAGIRL